MRSRGRLKRPPALVTPVSVEVSEGTEAIVVEEDGEVSSVSSRVLAPAVRAWLWLVGTRSWFEIVGFPGTLQRGREKKNLPPTWIEHVTSRSSVWRSPN
jgi:hypothetical protein